MQYTLIDKINSNKDKHRSNNGTEMIIKNNRYNNNSIVLDM